MTTRREFWGARVLLPDGWAAAVRIAVDARGDIVAIESDTSAGAARRLPGHVIPGVPNLHSHAFQRALAGGGERRSPAGRDSFWTWRETMYRFVGRFSPEDAEAVAAQLYVELLEHGFCNVAEFHYLHHQPDGTPYADRAEMAKRHLAAAKRAGIGITLLPSLYRHGGIFGQPPHEGQRRFLNDLDGFSAIVESARTACADDPQAAIGLAPHSLRAVTPDMLRAIAGFDGPIHIHAAEQPKEVAECIAATSARPVRWLLQNMPMDARWCVIHATHLDDDEVREFGRTGAVAGLCPTTEASLGDDIFRLSDFLAAGGRFGIGTDSHVGTAPAFELRQLETSQRLRDHARAVATGEANPHPGRTLLDAALVGGAQVSGRNIGSIAIGNRADLVELDDTHPLLIGRSEDALLDAWVFSGQSNPVRSVVCGGKVVVEAGRHVNAMAIRDNFSLAMRRLLA